MSFSDRNYKLHGCFDNHSRAFRGPGPIIEILLKTLGFCELSVYLHTGLSSLQSKFLPAAFGDYLDIKTNIK